MEFGFGSGVLTGTRTDLVGIQTPVRFGALQNVDVEFSGETKELFATNQYPIDTARGKVKVAGKAKVAEIKARMYNDLFFGQTVAAGSLRYSWNESTTLGTGAASYTVANAGSTPLTDQGVFYAATGNQLTPVSAAPSTAQYAFVPSTGVYSFGAGDGGIGMLVNYTYTSAAGFNIALGNPLMGNTPRFKAVLFQQFENNQVVLVLNACVSQRLTFPTRIDDYVIEDLDFSSFADAGGNVGSWNSTT
jgi:hypothetical protein